MRLLIAFRIAGCALPSLAGRTYACRLYPNEANGPVTIVTVEDGAVSVDEGGLSISTQTRSKTLPDVTYFTDLRSGNPSCGARFNPNGAIMYRYTLDPETGEVTYETQGLRDTNKGCVSR